MGKTPQNCTKLPEPLLHAWKRFDRWRKTHQPRARFSDELWAEAVTVARQYGHSRTAQVLGLDYYSLKRRLSETPVANHSNAEDAWPFVEFFPKTQAECTIVMENGTGRKMHISIKSGDMPDIVSLSRNFFGVDA